MKGFLKTNRKYLVYLIFAMVVIFTSLGGNYMTTSTSASYKSEVDLSDSGQIAKWDISSLDEEGEELQLYASIDRIIQGDGYWMFKVRNNSDVTACLDRLSNVKVRLDSDNFATALVANTIGWDFLESNTSSDTDNPITLQLYAFNGDVTVPADTAQKKGIEILLASDEAKNVFNAASLSFSRKTENVDGKDIFYYESEISFDKAELSTILSSNMSFSGTDTDKSKTFVLYWNVAGSDSDVNVSNATFKTYSYTTEDPGNNNYKNRFIIGGKYYYVIETELNYFDYLVYTASLGGEVVFWFDGVKVFYSKLSDAQKSTLSAYQGKYTNKNVNDTVTLNEIEKYIEYLEYVQYEHFLEERNKFEQSLGYLQYGLNLNIIFNVKISQVD